MANLLEVLDYTGSVLDEGRQFDVVYLDISRTFETISHVFCYKNYEKLDFFGSLLQWFQSYLTNRHQRMHACISEQGRIQGKSA